MEIAICDDEENVRAYIRKLVLERKPDCRIVEFSSGGGLLEEYDRTDGKMPDVIFLDIAMDDVDGMTAAKKLRERADRENEAVWGSLPLLIFITGYPEYMQDAFAVHAFWYLVKPIRKDAFTLVFDKAVKEYNRLTRKDLRTQKGIMVRQGNVTMRIPAGRVQYIESCNRKVILHLGKKKIEYYGKIGELEEELRGSFFRVHKGYLVNMEYVENYDRTEVKLTGGDALLISKYKYQDFVKAYLNYIAEGRN